MQKPHKIYISEELALGLANKLDGLIAVLAPHERAHLLFFKMVSEARWLKSSASAGYVSWPSWGLSFFCAANDSPVSTIPGAAEALRQLTLELSALQKAA